MAQQGGLSALAQAEERTAWWLLAPTLIILVLIAIYPLLSVFYLSFTNKRFASSIPTKVIGFQNYRELLTFRILPLEVERDDDGNIVRDENGRREYENGRLKLAQMFRSGELAFQYRDVAEDGSFEADSKRYDVVTEFGFLGQRYIMAAPNAPFLKSIGDTVLFTVVAVFLETLLGLIIALALSRKFFGRNFMRTAMLVPWAIITVVSSLIWEWMYRSDRSGLFNTILSNLGITDGNTVWLVNEALQMPSIIAIDVWKTTPFMALLLLAGLSTIPAELYEAAEVDGASAIRKFFSVTLPLLVPTLAVALIFRTLDSLRVFDLFQVVFGEARYSMATFTTYALISERDMGLSSATSVIIFIILFVFAIFYMRSLGVDND